MHRKTRRYLNGGRVRCDCNKKSGRVHSGAYEKKIDEMKECDEKDYKATKNGY